MSPIEPFVVEPALKWLDGATVAEDATTAADSGRGGAPGVPGILPDIEFAEGNMQEVHVATFHKPVPLHNLRVSNSVGWAEEDSR